jgi:hypothetical protein
MQLSKLVRLAILAIPMKFIKLEPRLCLGASKSLVNALQPSQFQR